MERLTERDEFGNADIIGVDSEELQINLDYEQFNMVTNALNKLAGYEDLEEQNRLLKIPCVEGSEVWYIDAKKNNEIVRGVVYGYDWYKFVGFVLDVLWDKPPRPKIRFSNFGKTAFLTKEEAESALQGKKQNRESKVQGEEVLKHDMV